MAENTFKKLKEIGKIVLPQEKGEIQFSIDSFKSFVYLSIRKYVQTEQSEDLTPTKSGITFNKDILDKVIECLDNNDLSTLKNTETKQLGKFAKSSGVSVIVNYSPFKDSLGIDFRIWQETKAYTGWTKKGIRISLEHIEEFKTLIKTAKEAFRDIIK